MLQKSKIQHRAKVTIRVWTLKMSEQMNQVNKETKLKRNQNEKLRIRHLERFNVLVVRTKNKRFSMGLYVRI